jgi:hypothetical protein
VRLAADGTARERRYPCEVGEPGDEDTDELDDWLEVFHADSLALAAAAVAVEWCSGPERKSA